MFEHFIMSVRREGPPVEAVHRVRLGFICSDVCQHVETDSIAMSLLERPSSETGIRGKDFVSSCEANTCNITK